VSPPELARDGPVADVLEPAEVHRLPARRHEAHLAGPLGLDGPIGQGPHSHEPLGGDERLDDRVAARADRQCVSVVLDLLQQALRFEVGDDALSRVEAVETRVGPGGLGHAAVAPDDRHLGQVVVAADLVVGLVVGRGHL